MPDAPLDGRSILPVGAGRIASALRTLDAFSFWVVPTETGDTVVAGTTGVFLVRELDVVGIVLANSGGVRVNGRRVPGPRAVRASAKAVGRTMTRASVVTSVEPVVCFTGALAGPPVSLRGVRYVAVKDLAADLAGRPTVLSRARAQRAARALGMQIAGDKHRHFTPS
jgi:hypothetical protein